MAPSPYIPPTSDTRAGYWASGVPTSYNVPPPSRELENPTGLRLTQGQLSQHYRFGWRAAYQIAMPSSGNPRAAEARRLLEVAADPVRRYPPGHPMEGQPILDSSGRQQHIYTEDQVKSANKKLVEMGHGWTTANPNAVLGNADRILGDGNFWRDFGHSNSASSPSGAPPGATGGLTNDQIRLILLGAFLASRGAGMGGGFPGMGMGGGFPGMGMGGGFPGMGMGSGFPGMGMGGGFPGMGMGGGFPGVGMGGGPSLTFGPHRLFGTGPDVGWPRLSFGGGGMTGSTPYTGGMPFGGGFGSGFAGGQPRVFIFVA